MADRYWVGGTGNTNDTARWSTASGGSGGASVPTSSDNVIFDDASAAGTFTVTVNATFTCADFTVSITNAAKKMTLTHSAAKDVYGSWTTPGSTLFAHSGSTGTLTFRSTATGKTISTGGVTIPVATTFDGVGGGWTLSDALAVTGAITVLNGALSAGGFNITPSANFTSTGSGTCSLNLTGTPTVTCGGWIISNANFSLTAGSSQITQTSGTQNNNFAALTYNNVTLGNNYSTGTINSTGSGATFNNLTVNDRTSTGVNSLGVNGDFTVNGTLTIQSAAVTDPTRRVFFYSGTLGTVDTFTCANPPVLNMVDFRDIASAGGGGTWSGASIGDCGGNSGITFTTPKTVYWNLAGSQNWSAVGWAPSSGGTPALSNFPLPQDTCVIDEAGAAGTITFNATWHVGVLDFSGRTTTAVTLASAQNINFYGNVTLSSQVTLSGTGNFFCSKRGGTQTITTAGRTWTQAFNLQNVGGTVQLSDALTTSLGLTLTTGTLDLQTYSVKSTIFTVNATNTTVMAFGSGAFYELTHAAGATTIWNCATITNFSFTGTSDVRVTGAPSGAISLFHGSSAGGSESTAMSFTVSNGAQNVDFRGHLRDVTFTSGFTGALTNTARTIYGDLTLNAANGTPVAGASGQIFAGSGTQNITSAGKTFDFPITHSGSGPLVLQDNLTVGSTRLFVDNGAGTLNINGKTLSVGTFTSSGSSARVIAFGTAGRVIVNGSGATAWSASGSGLTITGTGTISLNSASAKTFAGGGYNYSGISVSQEGAGTLTISGDNTLGDIVATAAGYGSTIQLTSGSTQTMQDFTLSGGAGNNVTFTANSTTAATISKASGTVSVSNLTISKSIAAGGAAFFALLTNGCVDGGTNTGWTFSAVLEDLAETATAADTQTGAIAVTLPITESATATDSQTGDRFANGVVAESVTATDSFSSALAAAAAYIEAASATDTLSSILAGVASILEAASATATESSTGTFGLSISETMTTDDLFFAVGATYDEALAETLSATDAISALSVLLLSVSESGNAEDFYVAVQDFLKGRAAVTIRATARATVTIKSGEP